jgi:hypothetical protein
MAFTDFNITHNLVIFGSIVWMSRDMTDRSISSHSLIFLISSAVGASGLAGAGFGFVLVTWPSLPHPPMAIATDLDQTT